MTLRDTDYALLAQDAYSDRGIEKNFYLDGVQYKAIAHADRPSGYQGTAYQRIDTGEIVIAHRGTEFGRQPIRDGLIADGGMVLAGYNSQVKDADDFTRQVLEMAKDREPQYGHPLDVTVTGHSLGGTLAEVTAYRHGLHGETFNAYGAADLLHGVPAGGDQIINNVRATDLVSAASKHFGEVRIYATQQDIDSLNKAGYHDDSGPLSLRNPIKGLSLEAHGIDNFTPNNDLLGKTIMTAENGARYQDHHNQVDLYRHDILTARTIVSAGWELPKAVVEKTESFAHSAATRIEQAYETVRTIAAEKLHEASDLARRTASGIEHAALSARDAVENTARKLADDTSRVIGAATEKAEHALETLRHPSSWFENKPATPVTRLDNDAHPDNPLFREARHAVHQLDAEHQRTPDQRSDNIAAALVVAARKDGMSHIDRALLSDDASRTFAVQGEANSPFKRLTEVPTADASATPVERSSVAWQNAVQQQQQASRSQMQQPPQEQTATAQPQPHTAPRG